MGTLITTSLVTAPTVEPLDLNEVKDHLRIDSSVTDFDAMVTSLIVEAREYIEGHTGRALITQTWDLYLSGLPYEVKLPYAPLQSVTSIKYQDLDNVQQTLAATNYTVDTVATPGRIVQAYGGTYPAIYPEINTVVIRFVAGYGASPTSVPESYKRAMLTYCQWQFDNDEKAGMVLDKVLNQNKINWF